MIVRGMGWNASDIVVSFTPQGDVAAISRPSDAGAQVSPTAARLAATPQLQQKVAQYITSSPTSPALMMAPSVAPGLFGNPKLVAGVGLGVAALVIFLVAGRRS